MDRNKQATQNKRRGGPNSPIPDFRKGGAKDTYKKPCAAKQQLYLTKDRGKTFKMIVDYVVQFAWYFIFFGSLFVIGV